MLNIHVELNKKGEFERVVIDVDSIKKLIEVVKQLEKEFMPEHK